MAPIRPRTAADPLARQASEEHPEMKRLCLAAAAAAMGLSFLSPAAHAVSMTFSGAGGPLADAGANDGEVGYSWFDIDISNTGGKVNAITSVTLTGLTHAYMGDIGIYLYGP